MSRITYNVCNSVHVLRSAISASLLQCSLLCLEDGRFPRNLRNSPQRLGALDHKWCTDLYQLSPKVGLKFHGLSKLTTLSVVSPHICCTSHIGKCTPSVRQAFVASTYTLWLFSNSHSHLCVGYVDTLSSLATSQCLRMGSRSPLKTRPK